MAHTCEKIMVAVDGSQESEQAFQKAIQIALNNHASLFIAHVIDTRALQTITSFDSLLMERASEMASELLAEFKQKALENGCKTVKTILEYGSPKPWIAQEIPSTYEIDLIVIGATGMSAIERLFIGSVSEYVVRHTQCDVLIVRTKQ